MWIRIKNLFVPLDENKDVQKFLAARWQIKPEKILQIDILRKTLDARRYHNLPIGFVYTLDVEFSDNHKTFLQENKKLAHEKDLQILHRDEKYHDTTKIFWKTVENFQKNISHRPVVVGFGCSGMFASLILAQAGFKPIIVERGADIFSRTKIIKDFWQTGKFTELTEKTNVQFGEGGAGTFSDGKLTTRIKHASEQIDVILEEFIQAGACEDIRFLSKAHIGTDVLREVVKNIREKIISLGGEIYFLKQLTDLEIHDGKISAVILNHNEHIETETVFLGIGHSSRDTYQMLFNKKIQMESKPFAVGVRIEHPQKLIDVSQYGADAGNPLLPVADYALTYQNKNYNAYSFCMCPGGHVVAAASEKNHVVTNGMSYFARDSGIANSALLVSVRPSDFGENILDGIAFQKKYEHLAFLHGGENYFAPVECVGDFLKNETKNFAHDFLCEPTYRPGYRVTNIRDCLPDFVSETLAKAIPIFGEKIRGFDDPRAVLTGVEMRSSSPCRIIRNPVTRESVNVSGLYPIGEGAGYAGGIMSASVDGLNAAMTWLKNL